VDTRLSRRAFGAAVAVGAAGAAGVAGLLGTRRLGGGEEATAGEIGAGLTPYCMAMHVHACWSEGPGSMEAQLTQAVRSGVDVVWWTEHDQRMTAHGYRQAVHFDGPVENENGLTWRWKPTTSGDPAVARGDFVDQPASPRPGSRPGSLHLRVVPAGGRYAEHRLSGAAEGYLYRTSLDGHVIEFDIRPESTSSRSFLALEITTSNRPARNGHPAGQYSLSYRVGGGRTPGTGFARGTKGIMTLGASAGQWTTVRVDPAADISRLWPGVDGRDAALFEVDVVATSYGTNNVEGYVDELRFVRRNNSDQTPLAIQAELMSRYAPDFPGVRQLQAMEMSLITPHVGWYGGRVRLPDHRGKPAQASLDPRRAQETVEEIHRAGGLACYNHPFGTSTRTLAAETDQDKALREKTVELLRDRALGCDLMEVGYRLRGGCDLERHESLWDTCSRNGIFLTGVGVNDDHKGVDWIGDVLNFVTWVWARRDDEAELLGALGAGRAWFADPARYRGRLDLLVDGRVPMGAVQLSREQTHRVRVTATDLPAGGSVELVRGEVDLLHEPSERGIVRTTLPGRATSSGDSTETEVSGSTPCFVRTVVRDATGLAVAYSNPVWLLRTAPPQGIPRLREV